MKSQLHTLYARVNMHGGWGWFIPVVLFFTILIIYIYLEDDKFFIDVKYINKK